MFAAARTARALRSMRRCFHSVSQGQPTNSWVSTRRTRVKETGLEITTYGARQDNFGFLVTSGTSGETIAVDTPEWKPLLTALEGRSLDVILNTHHHGDHVEGNEDAVAHFGANVRILGPDSEAKRIPKLTATVKPGDELDLGDEIVQVINVCGHTKGHVAYYFTKSKVLFPGDSIFPLGCGRVFEGTFQDAYETLRRLTALPGDTLIFSAHEYSASNAKFALWADPDNADLRAHVEHLKAKVTAREPTVPTTLAEELKFNPFLRAENLERFAELRKAKDNF
mmetsp:Transcript_3850/g.8293  ORF Transcript_3850/g.8293 Transcript_3850/m.8293 type:complete len:282 (-) Transcript_3850:446-1291(-)